MALQQQYHQPSQPPQPWGPPPLETALRQVVRRMRRLRWVRCAAFGAMIGEIAAMLAIIPAHLDLLPDWLPLELVIPFAIALGIGIGTIFAYARPIDLMDAARIAETRLGLKERLSSALEFEGLGRNPRDPVPSLLVRLQQRDAAYYAGNVRPKEAVPFRWPWQLKALIVTTVLLIVAVVLPNLPMFVSPIDRLERGIVQMEGKKLEQQARVIEKVADVEQLPHTKWAAQQMHRLAQQMQRGHMNKRQAFVKYGELNRQMQNIQKQLTENGSAQATKSLSEAGRQLAQSLQARANQNAPNSANPHSSQSAQGGSGGANANGSAKSASTAKGSNKQHGFNIPSPGSQNGAPGNPSQQQTQSQVTREIQQAAKALQNGDSRALSQQLRDLAQRTASGQLSHDQQQQAQQDLQALSDALKGTSMKETQKHAQAAADAMKQGDTQKAADEMRKAADAADREMKDQQENDAMRDAQKSLQNSRNEMAGARSPADVNQSQSGQGSQSQDSGSNGSDSGQGDSSGNQGNGQGQGDSKSAENELKRQSGGGQGKGQGQNQNGDGTGAENGGAGSANHAGQGGSHAHGQRDPNAKWHKFQGPPQKLDPNFDPSKFPKYNKIYLGKPHGGQQGELGKTMKTRPGPGGPHPVNSQVPYYNYVGPAKQAAEHAVDHEDIPPAYKDSVQKYFDSLTPSQ